MKTVNVERSQRDLFPHCFGLFNPAKSSHRDLKRLGPSIRAKGNRLSFENGLPNRQCPRPFNNLGQSFGYFLELSCENFYLISAFMDLNPGPVEFVFECCFAQAVQRLADI